MDGHFRRQLGTRGAKGSPAVDGLLPSTPPPTLQASPILAQEKRRAKTPKKSGKARVPSGVKSSSSGKAKSTKSGADAAASAVKTPPRGELIFDCAFESGNFSSVRAVSPFEYEITVRPDTHNARFRLWFFFKVSNVKKGQQVVFTVLNSCKTKSLFREGMTPVACSSSRPAWERILPKFCFYYKSAPPSATSGRTTPPPDERGAAAPPSSTSSKSGSGAYQLSFLFRFDREDDEYSFAYCFPYTYTMLQRELAVMPPSPLLHRTLLTRTELGRRVDLLRFATPRLLAAKRRPVVVVTARVHPGESPASFMCRGLTDFLAGSSDAAALLLDNVVLMVVPMLNPDGVFLGNYRANFQGYDLNRCWATAARELHPSVAAVKELLLMLHADEQWDLRLFIDLHAHSTAYSAFMYGNTFADNEPLNEEQWRFPRLVAARCKDFSLGTTKFGREPSKAGTGRRVIGELTLPTSEQPSATPVACYTLEVSFFCPADSKTKVKRAPFTEDSYAAIGRQMGLAFLDYYNLVPSDEQTSSRGFAASTSSSKSKND